jgi:hypothetical protein
MTILSGREDAGSYTADKATGGIEARDPFASVNTLSPATSAIDFVSRAPEPPENQDDLPF